MNVGFIYIVFNGEKHLIYNYLDLLKILEKSETKK